LYNKKAFFHALIQNASDLITILGADGTVLYESPSVSSILGYDLDELIGRNAFELVHPEDLDKARNAFAELVGNPRLALSADFRCLHKDGSWRVLSATGSNQLANPSICGIVVNSRDVTERRKIEEKLRQSEERFRKVFYTSPDAINMTRLSDGMSFRINEGFTRILGYAESEVVGRTTLELNLFANPEDRQRLVESIQRDGEVKNFEFSFRRKNETIGQGVMSASSVDFEGVEYLIGVTRDVTERRKIEEELRQSEDRFRRIFEHSPIGIAIIAPSNSVLDANNAFCDMLGYTSEELVGRDLREFIRPEKKNKGEKAMQDALAGKIPVYHIETQYQRKNRKSLWVETTATTIRDREGNILYALIMVEDISVRKDAEREREQLISQLQESLGKIKTLRGLIPICAWCKKIRDDAGYWRRVESYIGEHSDASFTHCICPACLNKEDPESYQEVFGDGRKAQPTKSRIDHRNSERMKLTKPINCIITVDSGESERTIINAILEEIGDMGMCVRTDHLLEVDSVIYSSTGADDTVGVVRWAKTAATAVGGYWAGIQFLYGDSAASARAVRQ
jgi:PAS domain S-box-containing protein